jgi:hypothetical protein
MTAPVRQNRIRERARERQLLLDRIIQIGAQVRACPDADLREALELAREELRRFDGEEPAPTRRP